MQEIDPSGMAFSNDGAKMFVVGDHGNDINEYTLSTPFDVSTADFVDSFSVSDEDTEPTGMAFSNNGLKMFVVGWDADNINEYTLDTPFDLSTVSYAGDAERFSVSGQDTSPQGMAFSNDGAKMFVVGDHGNLKMFVVGWIGEDINEYTLSTPFDVSTADFVDSFSVSDEDTESFDDVVFSVLDQERTPTGMAFSNANRHGVFKQRPQDVRSRYS
jgi:DNA-binding beta-propeller fold protein YncE